MLWAPGMSLGHMLFLSCYPRREIDYSLCWQGGMSVTPIFFHYVMLDMIQGVVVVVWLTVKLHILLSGYLARVQTLSQDRSHGFENHMIWPRASVITSVSTSVCPYSQKIVYICIVNRIQIANSIVHTICDHKVGSTQRAVPQKSCTFSILI